MSTIYSKSQIDRAMTVAYNQTRVRGGSAHGQCPAEPRQLARQNLLGWLQHQVLGAAGQHAL